LVWKYATLCYIVYGMENISENKCVIKYLTVVILSCKVSNLLIAMVDLATVGFADYV